MTGAGAPGATINLIRKKPTREFKASIDVGAGSWDNYRTQVDVSGPLTDSGNIRGRAVAAYQDKHSFMDRYERKTGVYFGTLEADLSDDTLLTLGFDYQNNDPTPRAGRAAARCSTATASVSTSSARTTTAPTGAVGSRPPRACSRPWSTASPTAGSARAN
ncbi:ferripyoverdine receptor [Pseudomonas fragi]|uniref:Ferripyoverdine receptor n=1 Tax=Pseudomonas fragi TaxID=296 RepID=A0A449IK45_PSEFR|nr:ferripyoverdine receptor [Pseudomonas fragi]